MIVAIDDPLDSRIAVFRDVRERDLTRGNALIAEGGVVLDQLLASRYFAPRALLVLRARLAGLEGRLAMLSAEVPVYVCERPVMDAIAGFPVHRGVLAHAERIGGAATPDLADLASTGAPVVVAAGLSNHDNMGAIFRNASAFGAGLVAIDPTACDPLYRKAVRVSVGTVLTMPYLRFDDTADFLGRLVEAGYTPVALSPAGAVPLRSFKPSGPVALFLGAEGEGLPETVMRAMATVSIEMREGLDSLNVATAAAIALYHFGAWPAHR